ncbi:MAG: hypothetical protein HQM09_25235, partial [Candidatus Riflebacteria bacterium]|nr:hypothetical protein [Candidatus Riflebacteria bacterium]
KKLLRQFEDHHDKVKAGLIDASIIPGKAFDRYIEIKARTIKPQAELRYRQLWVGIEKFLQEKEISYLNDLNSTIVSEYLSWRKASAKTMQEELRLLKAVLIWLVEQENLKSMPVARWPTLKTAPKNPDSIGGYTKDDVEKIIEHFKDHVAGSAITLLAFTGARRGSMESLKVKDVDRAAGT